jgi:hypothetical protein
VWCKIWWSQRRIIWASQITYCVMLILVRGWTYTRAVWKVSVPFEYLENWSCGLDVTWQPVRGDPTVHPWTVTLLWG